MGVKCDKADRHPRCRQDCKHFEEHEPIEGCDEGFRCPVCNIDVRCEEVIEQDEKTKENEKLLEPQLV